MKKKTSNGTIAFRIIYLSLTFLAALLIAAALFILWNGLSAYEKSDPEIPMNTVMEEFGKNKSALVKNLNASVNEFEDREVLNDYLDALTAGELSYSRNGKKSTNDRVIYSIKAGDGVIAEAEVVKSDKELGYGFYKYELNGITFGEIPTHDYSVTAPDSARVFCNGIMISSSYITDRGEIYPESEHFQGLLSAPPKDVTYTLSGFISEAEFTAYDGAGNPLELKDGKFSLAQIADGGLTQLALDFSKAYSRYVVNDGKFGEAADYLASGTPFYSELGDYENFWHNWHSGYDFLDVEAEDPVFYDEKCAAVRVKYDHVLYGVNSSENGELHSKADYTVYLVKTNGSWLVVDLAFN